MFELANQQMQFENTDGSTQLIDLTNTQQNVLGLLLNDDLNYVDLLYDLTGNQNDPLMPFGPERELVFSIGAEEAQATITPGGVVRFENLDHLALLDSSDMLTIRLYQNSDAENILWERTLEGLFVITSDNSDSDLNNSFVITTQSGILQSDGTALQYPQDPFVLQLINPIETGDTYRWEIEIPDTDKYGDLQFTGAAPVGSITIGTGNPRTYTWDSGLLTDAQYRTLKFRPVERNPRHTPTAYCGYNCTPRGGTYLINDVQKNPQYTYNIKVTINSTVLGRREYTRQIKMDHKDMIRQEYITHLSQVASISDIVRVPSRDELIEPSSLQGVLTGDWSDAPYDFLYERHMRTLTTLVRDGFINQQPQSYPTPGGGSATLPSGADQFTSLRLNSGWRNPERNEIVGGVSTSRHMVGRATDVGTSGVIGNEPDTTSRAELMWTLWNTAEILPASQQNGPRFRWLLEDARNAGPFGVGLVEAGITTRPDAPEPNGVPDVVPNIDDRGETEDDPEDGIPDVFNYASHLHAETKPTRTCANGQVRWDCE